MLDNSIKAQLSAYLENLKQPIELIASLNDTPQSAELWQLLEDIAALNTQVSIRNDGSAVRRPSFAIAKQGESARVSFAGIPMGHEFTSLVLALLHVSGHPPKISEALAAQIRQLSTPTQFETFVSLSCHNCPDVVQALNTIAALNPQFSHQMVDGALFQEEVDARQIMAVPMVFQNNTLFGQGRMILEEIVAKLDTHTEERDKALLNNKDPFDVLVVGGGPAGTAAAIYAARKGIRTGIVASRFGGQIMDTLAIENYISVKHTEGPVLAADMRAHVDEYGVDVMNLQQVQQLSRQHNMLELTLENGAVLHSKSVILATGARWREMNVPGEQTYRGKGVAYCPHCDGPLFKGKRVAVIGGGNSGVEAAIDLAGVVQHVTLIEFDAKLRADAVLQAKLHSLPNVTVMTSALSTEVHGDGSKVTALSYTNRLDESLHRIELDGIFVQIGLLPNTDWLKGSEVKLTPRGEIEVNAKCETAMEGVFAAGDATTVPYKQIIIATGEGAKAALSAFDYLIRT